jgi:hypothetical protein
LGTARAALLMVKQCDHSHSLVAAERAEGIKERPQRAKAHCKIVKPAAVHELVLGSSNCGRLRIANLKLEINNVIYFTEKLLSEEGRKYAKSKMCRNTKVGGDLAN